MTLAPGRLAVDVEGALTAESEAGTVAVTASGDSVEVAVPNLKAARLLRLSVRTRAGRESLHGLLLAMDLRVTVRLAGRPVALFGKGANAGIASRLLGVAPGEFRVVAALRAALGL